MLLAELKQVAGTLGLKGTAGMRKGELVGAIRDAQGGGAPAASRRLAPPSTPIAAPETVKAPDSAIQAPSRGESAAQASASGDSAGDTASAEQPGRRRTRGSRREAGAPSVEASQGTAPERTQTTAPERTEADRSIADEVGARLNALGVETREPDRQRRQGQQGQQSTQGNDEDARQAQRSEDEDAGGRRGRRRRNRDRQNRRPRPGQAPVERFEAEPTVNEGDVVVPISGILDVLDNYAFVRTSGYLPGSNDAYVSLSMVRRYGLRKGDVVTGSIRQPLDGERKEKFNPLVSLDTVNGGEPESARNRPEFSKLTPLYPQEPLRLENATSGMIGRIIDLVSPIGKGQRGLIVSRPRATRRSPSWRSSGPSGSWRPAATSSSCSTASPAWGARTTWRPRPPDASCPAASTRPRCTRRRGSSARRATSRTAAR